MNNHRTATILLFISIFGLLSAGRNQIPKGKARNYVAGLPTKVYGPNPCSNGNTKLAEIMFKTTVKPNFGSLVKSEFRRPISKATIGRCSQTIYLGAGSNKSNLNFDVIINNGVTCTFTLLFNPTKLQHKRLALNRRTYAFKRSIH